jgi:hypothetical protein
MTHVVHCPLLLYMAGAILWGSETYPPDEFSLTQLRHVLNVSWDEVRTALCSLGPIMQPLRPRIRNCYIRGFAGLLIRDWKIAQPGAWRAKICNRLAWGCIRMRKQIDAGLLPDKLW